MLMFHRALAGGNTTLSTDTTPDAFGFTDQVDVAISSTITSAAITVSGINAAATITSSGGTFDINASGTFISSGTVNNGDTVRARVTSSSSNSTTVNCVVTIGGVSDTFTATTVAAAGTALFSDDFSSNDFSHTENGIAWLAATANTAVVGNKLQFTYPARAMGSDGWSEQRLYYIKKAGNPLSEIWVKYDIEIPANYYHRDDTVDHNNVNKFLTFYAKNYGDGFEARFDLQAGSAGQSLIQYSVYINQVEISAYTTSAIAIATADFGTTISIIAHVKTETSNGSNDGVMQIWKKAQGAGSYTKLHERKAGSSYLNMGNLWGGPSKNYIDEVYFWGWANSGFTNQTIINIDNVVVSDTNLWGVS